MLPQNAAKQHDLFYIINRFKNLVSPTSYSQLD